MELKNQFQVALPVDEAWVMLVDLERIAPCLPGAKLTGSTGDEYQGVIKVKVGPITAEYKGVARFVERDASAHRAVLQAEGRETRGQGNARAAITTELISTPAGTEVRVVTDLAITGKAAQFGRGVLEDVSAKYLEQFVANLHKLVLTAPSGAVPVEATGDDGAGNSTGGAGANGRAGRFAEPVEQSSAQPQSWPAPDTEPLDLLQFAGPTLVRKAVPVLAAALAVLLLVLARRRRIRSGPASRSS